MAVESTDQVIDSSGIDSAGSYTDDVLRLHLNESPYGAPPRALERVAREFERSSSLYPEGESEQLRSAIAASLGCTTDMVAVGNGTDELVHLTALAFHRQGVKAVATASTFPGYLMACSAVGMEYEEVPLNGHRVAPGALVTACRAGAGLVFLCNPHNPTGTLLAPADLDLVLTAAEDAGAVVVIDEAYMDFVADGAASALEAVRRGRRAIVLRTFSKAWALASLRVGYAVGPADLIAELWRARQSMPFNVNRLAQVAVPAALDEPEFLHAVRRRTSDARELLCRRLEAIGATYVPSETNFVMVEAAPDSTEVARRLADEHRILVRDLSVFAQPGWLRVTVGTADEVERFASALEAVLEGRPRASRDAPDDPHWRRPVPTLAPMEPSVLFNGFVGAQVAFALHRLDAWKPLADAPTTSRRLAAQAGVSNDWMLILLRTMALLGYVELRGEAVALTPAGRALNEQIGLVVWGVGGYGAMLGNLRGLAAGELTYGSDVRRDEALVAIGSGEADQALMQAIEARLLASTDFDTVADIGCGAATRLVRLCASHPERRGIGIDISGPACALASERVHEAGLADRVEIIHEDILETMRTRSFPGVEVVTCFLMLHDLFAARDDRAEVIRSLRSAFPDAHHFLFADTVAQPWERHTGAPPIFSVAFELVHAVMGVPLEPKETYLRAFSDAGLHVERCEPFGVPATWAFLLSVPR